MSQEWPMRSNRLTSVWLYVSVVLFLLLEASMWAQEAAPDAAMATIRPEAIRADMRFLADDLLEGRGTATRGFDIAAKFMATQFEGMGLQPAGDNGTYFQNVPLRLLKPDPAKSALVLIHGGKGETLTFGNNRGHGSRRPGIWMLHGHVDDHMNAAMATIYKVEP